MVLWCPLQLWVERENLLQVVWPQAQSQMNWASWSADHASSSEPNDLSIMVSWPCIKLRAKWLGHHGQLTTSIHLSAFPTPVRETARKPFSVMVAFSKSLSKFNSVKHIHLHSKYSSFVSYQGGELVHLALEWSHIPLYHCRPVGLTVYPLSLTPPNSSHFPWC